MMETQVFTVTVERDGRFWHIWSPDVERGTSARNLREVDEMARDLIALMLDIDPRSFELDVRIELPGDAATVLEEARRQRERAAAANAHSAYLVRSVALNLSDAGLTVRDIGDALGVSHQRAQQLVQEAGGPKPKLRGRKRA